METIILAVHYFKNEMQMCKEAVQVLSAKMHDRYIAVLKM